MVEIKDIQRIALGEGEILWVTMPRGNLPYHLYKKLADNTRTDLEMLFLTTRILITPEGYDFKVISEDNFLESPTDE